MGYHYFNCVCVWLFKNLHELAPIIHLFIFLREPEFRRRFLLTWYRTSYKDLLQIFSGGPTLLCKRSYKFCRGPYIGIGLDQLYHVTLNLIKHTPLHQQKGTTAILLSLSPEQIGQLHRSHKFDRGDVLSITHVQYFGELNVPILYDSDSLTLHRVWVANT